MDWVHCARCGHWPRFAVHDNRQRLQYKISSCGRLFCENCVVATGGKCTCQNNQCRIIAMSQAGKEVMNYFKDPAPSLKEVIEGIKRTELVLKFQSGLQRSCCKLLDKMFEIHRNQSNEINSLKAANATLTSEIQQLKKTNESLKQSQRQGASGLSTSMLGAFATPTAQTSSGQSDPLGLFRQSPKPTSEVPPFQQFGAAPSPIPFAWNARNGATPSPSSTQSSLSRLSNFTGLSHGPSPSLFRTPQSTDSSFISTPSRPGYLPATPGRTPGLITHLRNLRCSTSEN